MRKIEIAPSFNIRIMNPVQIIFLGTGGGRFVTITQKRRTAGIRILSGNLNLHLDPGPGGLVYSIQEGLDPQKLNAVLVSHCHPDHSNDAEVLIEAMTRGGTKEHGVLIAAKSVLHGGEGCEASISSYHQHLPAKRVQAVPATKLTIDEFEISATEARHTDPDAVGFRFRTDFGDIGYTSDSEFFEGIERYYEHVRLLILCVMRPAGKPWKGHMTTDDAIRILEAVHPEQAILTHLGMKMIFQGASKQAELIQEKTGVKTVAATDQMKITFGTSITIQSRHPKTREDISGFF